MAFQTPGFDKFPLEAILIGRLVVGYGEIEWVVHECLSAVLGDVNTSVRVMYRAKGEEVRLEVADALMRHKFDQLSLTGPYTEAMADAHWCRRIRNQYAHSHYDGLSDMHLCFVSFDQTAKIPAGETFVSRKPISLSLLQEQEAYFGYVQGCFFYLQTEYQVRAGLLTNHKRKLPKKVARPLLHNEPP